MRRFSTLLCGCAMPLAAELPRAQAVIIYGSPGNNYVNVSPVPISTDGETLDEYEGDIDGFLGTAISSRYFVTANHITYYPTATFSYRNGTADTLTNYDVIRVGVDDDLAVWEISPATPAAVFANWAPLYTAPTEIGQPLLVMGVGTARGDAVPGGWAWGDASNIRSWGTNTVSATPDSTDIGAPAGFGGSFLQYDFDANSGNPNEAIISSGDSGGGVFVQDPTDGVYKLAGINSLVDEVDDSSGNALSDALYDDTGYYYYDSAGNLMPIPSDETGPLSSFATRISSRIDFIDAVTGLPEPGGVMLIGGLLLPAIGRRRRPA